eukprot:TRINITY_DN1078_c0_g1_i1.p1 TRINITY_DN1078_c0_g1~~TRINITY_DN1078_c0_g1_i1.p1  ORF type:complete len:359 (+),score=86.77 TRINITY_DN1078_c0_g1_i1:53-1129(+)
MIRGFASASANQKSRYLLAALVFFVIVFVIVRMFPPIEPEIETVAPPLTKLSFKSFPQILPPDSFRFAIIADKDKKAKDEQGWTSHFRTGVISRFSDGTYKVEWESQVKINSQFNEAGRGMELSELVNFNGRLLSFDDRTGIVFEIIGSDAVPRYILMDGDGKSGKGYKSEWATIKDGYLYVGSMGKEWSTPQGEVINHNPQFVKRIDKDGHIESLDWRDNYQAMRKATGTLDPGYLVHESGYWHEQHKKWYFLPRRVSKERYDEVADENRGSNIVIRANENFTSIDTFTIGDIIPKHGFASFKFVPNHSTDIVALKSEEDGPEARTFIAVYNTEGKTLMEETFIDDIKFEGLEFLSY